MSDRDASDTLMFSFLGYSKMKIPVSKYIASKVERIAMSRETFELKELVIKPKTAREYVEIAVNNTPKHYKTNDYNSMLFNREVVKINGEYLMLNESILKGYFAPIIGGGEDTSRIEILAYREYENKSLLGKSDEELEERMTLYESLLNVFVDFSAYRMWDSTLTRQWFEDKRKYDDVYFEHGEVLRDGDVNIMTIDMHDKRKEERSNAVGQMQLDYDKMAVRGAHLQARPSGLKYGMMKTLLRVARVKLVDFFAYLDYDYHLVRDKYVPFSVNTSINVVLERVRWFKPNDLIHIEVDVFTTTLGNNSPAVDKVTDGKLMEKHKHISEQVDGEFGKEEFDYYQFAIKKESFFE